MVSLVIIELNRASRWPGGSVSPYTGTDIFPTLCLVCKDSLASRSCGGGQLTPVDGSVLSNVPSEAVLLLLLIITGAKSSTDQTHTGPCSFTYAAFSPTLTCSVSRRICSHRSRLSTEKFHMRTHAVARRLVGEIGEQIICQESCWVK